MVLPNSASKSFLISLLRAKPKYSFEESALFSSGFTPSLIPPATSFPILFITPAKRIFGLRAKISLQRSVNWRLLEAKPHQIKDLNMVFMFFSLAAVSPGRVKSE